MKKLLFAVIAFSITSLFYSCNNEETKSELPVENPEYIPEPVPDPAPDPEPEPDPEPDESSEALRKFRQLNNNIPLVYIENDVPYSEWWDKETYMTSTITVVDKDETETVLEESAVKGRGNSSWSFFPEKHPMTLKLASKTSVLGMPKSKKWVLVANQSDRSLLRNRFASYLGRNIFTGMKWNPDFINVDVIYNGEYLGNYTFGEQIKIDSKRVNIQSLEKACDGSGADVNEDGTVDIKDGGFILEVCFREDSSFQFESSYGVKFTLKDPDDTDIAAWGNEHKNYITGITNAVESAIYNCNGSAGNTYADLCTKIDETSFADWILMNSYMRNTDSIIWTSSAYMYYNPADGKMYMGPDWDFDIAAGVYDGYACGYDCDNDSVDMWDPVNRWIRALLNIPEFRTKCIARWKELSAKINEANSLIQILADENAASAAHNFTKHQILGHPWIWPYEKGAESRTTYQAEVDYFKNWMTSRYTWVNENIDNFHN